MDEDRRQVDIDLTDIKLNIREIQIHMKRSVPALEQVWKNEKEILVLATTSVTKEQLKEEGKDNRGRLVSYASLIISTGMACLLWLKHLK